LLLIDEDLKRVNIKFPKLDKPPSRSDSLASLVQLGEYTYSILMKFLKSRNIAHIHVKVGGNIKVKKYMDCIHYELHNQKHFHLIYYFSGKIYFGQWTQLQVDTDGYKHGFGYYYKPHKYIYEG
jgi:hypothetical protein